jgi:hypothetical protein
MKKKPPPSPESLASQMSLVAEEIERIVGHPVADEPFKGLTADDIEDCLVTTDHEVRRLQFYTEAPAMYAELVELFGPAEAKRMWTSVHKRTGRPKGHRDPMSDAWLMHLYSREARSNPVAARNGSLPRLVAKSLYEPRRDLIERAGAIGIVVVGRAASAEALEKHIRILLKERRKGSGALKP